MLGVVLALVLLGGGALAMWTYVGQQAEGYELTLKLGARTTHVLGTNVTLTEGEHETKCVLSLLAFRTLRDETIFLRDVAPLEKPPRGAPTFELALTGGADGASVSQGALGEDRLAPIEQFVIRSASACIETFVPKGPTPVR